MITYNFNSTPKTNEYSDNNTFYFPKSKSTNYSKTLDDLIFDDLMDKNKWLSDYFEKPTKTETLKIKIKDNSTDPNAEFYKYFNTLYNYKTNGITKYIILDKYYDLGGDGIFCLSNNYICINGHIYWFDDIKKKNFIDLLPKKDKKTICTIFTDTLKINIKA